MSLKRPAGDDFEMPDAHRGGSWRSRSNTPAAESPTPFQPMQWSNYQPHTNERLALVHWKHIKRNVDAAGHYFPGQPFHATNSDCLRRSGLHWLRGGPVIEVWVNPIYITDAPDTSHVMVCGAECCDDNTPFGAPDKDLDHIPSLWESLPMIHLVECVTPPWIPPRPDWVFRPRYDPQPRITVTRCSQKSVQFMDLSTPVVVTTAVCEALNCDHCNRILNDYRTPVSSAPTSASSSSNGQPSVPTNTTLPTRPAPSAAQPTAQPTGPGTNAGPSTGPVANTNNNVLRMIHNRHLAFNRTNVTFVKANGATEDTYFVPHNVQALSLGGPVIRVTLGQGTNATTHDVMACFHAACSQCTKRTENLAQRVAVFARFQGRPFVHRRDISLNDPSGLLTFAPQNRQVYDVPAPSIAIAATDVNFIHDDTNIKLTRCFTCVGACSTCQGVADIPQNANVVIPTTETGDHDGQDGDVEMDDTPADDGQTYTFDLGTPAPPVQQAPEEEDLYG